jgi:hypothetical protein
MHKRRREQREEEEAEREGLGENRAVLGKRGFSDPDYVMRTHSSPHSVHSFLHVRETI